MNPYLEQEDAFHDFHERFCPECAKVLTAQVRPNYIVKIDEHVYIHELPADQRQLVGRADVGISSRRPPPSPAAAPGLVQAPLYGRIPLAVDVERQSFVQILDRQSRRVVTVVELLSPSNKYAGADRDQYVAKRQQVLTSRVHLVEIDVLRGGPRLPVEGLPACDYYVMVSRAEDRPAVALWPIGLRDRLPVVPIPLSDPHPPATLDLQALLHRIYDEAGYEDYIYTGAPQPALSEEDAAWAQQRLAQGRVVAGE
jgi:hypothetical protein